MFECPVFAELATFVQWIKCQITNETEIPNYCETLEVCLTCLYHLVICDGAHRSVLVVEN